LRKLSNFLRKIINIISRFKSQKFNSHLVSITILNPYLSRFIEYLLKTQEQSGSWEGDALITATVLEAFHNVLEKNKLRSNELKICVRRGIAFLRNSFDDMSTTINEAEDLYAGFDRFAISFFRTFYVLHLFNAEISDFNYEALRKMINFVRKWHRALENLEVDCALISCFKYMDSRIFTEYYTFFKKIVERVIRKYLSIKSVSFRDYFLASSCLLDLRDSNSKVFYEIWNEYVTKRTDRYHNISFEETLNVLFKVNVNIFLKENYNDVQAFSYLLKSLNKANIINKIELEKEVNEQVFQLLVSCSIETLSPYEVGLMVCSLSVSPFSEIVIFPKYTEYEVKDILKKYEKLQKEGSIILEKLTYQMLIFYLTSLTAAYILLFILIFFEVISPIAIAHVAITILSLLLSFFLAPIIKDIFKNKIRKVK